MLADIFNCLSDDDVYSDAEIKGCLLILLSELLRNLTLVENNSGDSDIIKDIINYCYSNYDSDISLQSMSDELHISQFYISRLFNKKLKISFNDYINSIRIQNACKMLKNSEKTITEIATSVGYNSVRTFDRCFLKIKGTTPKNYCIKALKKDRQETTSPIENIYF